MLYVACTAMRTVEIEAPHFTERIAAAEQLLVHRDRTLALADADRILLLDTLHSAGRAIRKHVHEDQLLHGEPHPGNLLGTAEGPLFIDFETCCRGPIEFDVAHVSDEVGVHYPGLDKALLQECGRLILGWSRPGAGMRATSSRTGVGTPSRFFACSETGHPGQHRAPSSTE